MLKQPEISSTSGSEESEGKRNLKKKLKSVAPQIRRVERSKRKC